MVCGLFTQESLIAWGDVCPTEITISSYHVVKNYLVNFNKWQYLLNSLKEYKDILHTFSSIL